MVSYRSIRVSGCTRAGAFSKYTREKTYASHRVQKGFLAYKEVEGLKMDSLQVVC